MPEIPGSSSISGMHVLEVLKMSALDKSVYVLQMDVFPGTGYYGGRSDSLVIDERHNQPFELLQGILPAPEKRLVCHLPLGVPRARAIVSMDVFTPVLTEEAALVWREHGIMGWRELPVDLFNEKKGEPAGTGVAALVTGRARVGEDLSARPDAPDIFLLEPVETAFVYVSARLKNICESAAIAGVAFTLGWKIG